nr:kynurenine--oxoglutarate transaminase 3-like isoform X2 [Petromyzon marinus]
MVRMAGATPVFVALRPRGQATSSADWCLDPHELASKFNSRTKALILNTPNNPLGKVYTREELQVIADLCVHHDVLCISDEVYEWLVYSGHTHTRIATLPGMWERTLTVGSAGKTFSVTGWKLGWTVGPDHLVKHLQTVHQNCIYTCPTPTQEAVAQGLQQELLRLDSSACYFRWLPRLLQAKRDRLASVLSRAGMRPTLPHGGYFMVADFSGLVPSMDLSEEKDPHLDYRVVKWMAKHKKLATIPMTAFYSEGSKKEFEHYIRFCFIKEDSTLDAAEKILNEWANVD